MSQGLSHSLSLIGTQIRSQVPKFGTKLFNVSRYSVVPTQFVLYSNLIKTVGTIVTKKTIGNTLRREGLKSWSTR